MTTEFAFPWQHSFAPFYTIQPNLITRKLQMDAWASLITGWCCHKKLHILDVKQSLQDADGLFCNRKIDRQLSQSALSTILEEMNSRGLVEWCNGDKNSCYVYWRTVEDWARLIHTWAGDRALVNSVCTFYEITDDDSEDTDRPFYKLDQNVLVKALRHLQSQGKAALITVEGMQGVKFL